MKYIKLFEDLTGIIEINRGDAIRELEILDLEVDFPTDGDDFETEEEFLAAEFPMSYDQYTDDMLVAELEERTGKKYKII